MSVTTVTPVGIIASATFTPTAVAYTAGWIMGSPAEFVWTYTNGLPIPTGSLIRVLSSALKIPITAVPSGQTSYTLRKYSRTPPSALANAALWVPKTADFDYRRKPILLGTPALEAVGGDYLAADTQYSDSDIKMESTSSSTWGQLVTDGAHTATAVARTVILHGVLL